MGGARVKRLNQKEKRVKGFKGLWAGSVPAAQQGSAQICGQLGRWLVGRLGQRLGQKGRLGLAARTQKGAGSVLAGGLGLRLR